MPAKGTQHVNEYTHAHDHKSGKLCVLEGFPLFVK